MTGDSDLSEIVRAEDILLGAMGLAEDAALDKVEIEQGQLYFLGHFRSDKEEFRVAFDCEIADLEKWAIEILRKDGRVVG